MKFTINGKNYELVERYHNHIISYCEIGDKWVELTRTFSNWDEVEDWKHKMEHPQDNTMIGNCSRTEYDNTGRYYGD